MSKLSLEEKFYTPNIHPQNTNVWLLVPRIKAGEEVSSCPPKLESEGTCCLTAQLVPMWRGGPSQGPFLTGLGEDPMRWGIRGWASNWKAPPACEGVFAKGNAHKTWTIAHICIWVEVWSSWCLLQRMEGVGKGMHLYWLLFLVQALFIQPYSSLQQSWRRY